jgi:hypothetical protein
MTKIIAALGALLTCLLIAPPAVAAAPGDGQVVYYNLYDGEVEPTLIFTAFNSSPTLKVKRWTDWGEATAVGRGTWQSTCASCPPPKRRRAVVELSRIKPCEDGTSYYSKGVVTVAKPDRGETRTTYRLSTGCPPPD